MSIRVDECEVTVDFYGDHDRHRLEADRKLLRGGGGAGDSPAASAEAAPPMSTPATSTPNPSTSSASNERKRREPDSDRAEAAADKRPRRILNSDGELHDKKSCTINSLRKELVMIAESGVFDGDISFTIIRHFRAGIPLVREAANAAVAADHDALTMI